MVRRNMFQPPAPPPENGQSAPETKSRFPSTGAISGVAASLRDLSSNAVRDVDTSLIDEDGPQDRLPFTSADVEALAASIRQHGLQVPIMLRPNETAPGRFRIVYGRRRLHALRLLGLPAKALIRSLTDAQAILAQGQENTQRLDPSFIEKTLFAQKLAEESYENSVIQDALAIDKAMLSRMNKVARAIPVDVIELIGPAHGVGRRRWEALADQAQQVDLTTLEKKLDASFSALPSDQRFDAVLTSLSDITTARPAPSPAQRVIGPNGKTLAELRETSTALTIKVLKTESPEFALWLQQNAETELTRLFEAWMAERPDDET